MGNTPDLNPVPARPSKRMRLACLARTLHTRIGAEKEALSTALNKLRGLMSSAVASETLVDLVLEEVRKFGRKKTVFENRCYKLFEKGHRLPRLRPR